VRKIQCSHDGCSKFIEVESATSDATYTCADHTPKKRAEASAATNIPPEIESWAKESSSTQTNITPILSISEEQPDEAETSEGTQTVCANADIDDAADVTDRNRHNPAVVSIEQAKRPRYLKSVPQPVIPTNNPDAPFGYDDNDRPIGVPVGKPYVKPELKAIVERPSVDLLSRATRVPETEPETKPVTVDLEENARRFFGITAFIPPTTPKPKKPFDYYPEILGITRKQLIELFDTVVETETVETQLRSMRFVRYDISRLTKTIEHAKKRLQCIPPLIQRSERLIFSWKASVMKRGSLSIGIPPRAPENYLDEKTRERYKYYEEKKIRKYKSCETRLEEIIRKKSSTDKRITAAFG
jgi:hypothetical protein